MHYDVVINGAGIVGLTLACALGDSLRIAIVEGKPLMQTWQNKDYDLRVSAVTRASKNIFQKLGVWQAMQDMRASPFSRMFVWDSEGTGSIHFDSVDIGEPELGHIVENSVMQISLLQKLKFSANVDILCPEQLKDLRILEDQCEIGLANGNSITAKLVVGADGAQSLVRTMAGIALQEQEYGHSALVANVRTTLPHDRIARQVFLPTGPLAFLPLVEENWCSIVWSTMPADAERLLQSDPLSFKAELTKALAQQLGTVEKISERFVFPLHKRHAKNYVKPRVVLIGDAAHTIHPLAGQGLNLGLLDAACLAEVILADSQKKYDFGLLLTLRRYERWRKGHNLAMITAMDMFKQLFGSQNSLLKLLRNYGLMATNRMPVLKEFLVRYAMGLAGDLPMLAKEVNEI